MPAHTDRTGHPSNVTKRIAHSTWLLRSTGPGGKDARIASRLEDPYHRKSAYTLGFCLLEQLVDLHQTELLVDITFASPGPLERSTR